MQSLHYFYVLETTNVHGSWEKLITRSINKSRCPVMLRSPVTGLFWIALLVWTSVYSSCEVWVLEYLVSLAPCAGKKVISEAHWDTVYLAAIMDYLKTCHSIFLLIKKIILTECRTPELTASGLSKNRHSAPLCKVSFAIDNKSFLLSICE